MPSARIENALHGHGAGRQLAQVAALKALSHPIVKAPHRVSVELGMIRRSELLHDGVNLTRGRLLRASGQQAGRG